MRKSTAILSVVVAVLAVALVTSIMWSGRPTDVAAPTPLPTASTWPVHAVAGTGSQPITFPVPAGANSVTLSLVCTGESGVGLDVGTADTRFAGCNDGEHVYTFPAHRSSGVVSIQVNADDSSHFALGVQFSPATFGADVGIARQCESFSQVFSAIFLAEQEYAQRAISRDQWAQAIHNAAIMALGIPTEQTILDSEVQAMQNALVDKGVRPGDLSEGLTGGLHPPQPNWAAAVNLAEQVCDYNGSGVQIVDAAGG